MKEKVVHIYSHTHWDQEWYFTSSRSRIYLFNHVKNVIRVLENDDDFFLLSVGCAKCIN